MLDRTVERILDMVGRARVASSSADSGLRIALAGTTIALDLTASSFEHQLERLASAIEATIAFERASAMLAAVGLPTGPVPLWLVTGSSVLAQWLIWSRSEMTLRRVLKLSDEADVAPIVGTLNRSARAALGQTAAKIRVANGVAVATRIELPGRYHCVLAMGRKAELTVMAGAVPATIVAALVGRPLAALGDHPFFAATDFVITAARNDEQRLVVEVAHEQGPLAPIPKAALAVVPAVADPSCPWQPTETEVTQLYALVDTLRRHKPGA